MTAHLVRGKDRELITRDFFVETSSAYRKVVLDIGAGDGKGSLRFARQNPDVLVIALDSSFDALNETSKSASKKQSRGGAENLVCIYGNIKDAAEEFENIADLVRVYLPWGDLLEGIAEVSKEIVSPISSCVKIGGDFEIVINAEIWKSNLPKHLEHIGEITPEFFQSNYNKYREFGIEIRETHAMSIDEIECLDTTWTHKLMSSRESAEFIMAKGVRI